LRAVSPLKFSVTSSGSLIFMRHFTRPRVLTNPFWPAMSSR
jgi:hypothetical protein